MKEVDEDGNSLWEDAVETWIPGSTSDAWYDPDAGPDEDGYAPFDPSWAVDYEGFNDHYDMASALPLDSGHAWAEWAAGEANFNVLSHSYVSENRSSNCGRVYCDSFVFDAEGFLSSVLAPSSMPGALNTSTSIPPDYSGGLGDTGTQVNGTASAREAWQFVELGQGEMESRLKWDIELGYADGFESKALVERKEYDKIGPGTGTSLQTPWEGHAAIYSRLAWTLTFSNEDGSPTEVKREWEHGVFVSKEGCDEQALFSVGGGAVSIPAMACTSGLPLVSGDEYYEAVEVIASTGGAPQPHPPTTPQELEAKKFSDGDYLCDYYTKDISTHGAFKLMADGGTHLQQYTPGEIDFTPGYGATGYVGVTSKIQLMAEIDGYEERRVVDAGDEEEPDDSSEPGTGGSGGHAPMTPGGSTHGHLDTYHEPSHAQ